MNRSLLYLAALLLLLPAGGCLLPQKDTVPMRAIWQQRIPSLRAQQLFVFLPGRRDHPEDFVRNGFVESLWSAGIEADIVLVDAHLGYYYRRTFSERLEQDILQVARDRGYASIWVVGVSLGGFGAVMFERDHPGSWDGIVLIAPFVGDQREVLEQIHVDGDLQAVRFEPSSTGDDYTAGFWDWMRQYQTNPDLPIFMGYGQNDSMVRDQMLLVDVLPAERIVAIPGNHRWWVWQILWPELLLRVKELLDSGAG